MYAAMCTRKSDGEVQLTMQNEPLEKIIEWVKYIEQHNEEWTYVPIKYELVTPVLH